MQRLSQRTGFQVAVAAAAFTFCYASVLAELFDRWMNNSTYSYGFAIPLISSYIVWAKWDALRLIDRAPDYRGGTVLVLLGATMLGVGALGGLMSLEAVSLLVSLIGLVLLFGGRAVLRLLRFPIAYLVLMLPIWDYLFASLQLPGQRLAASIATALLHATGIPALHQGTTIVLSSVSLEVMPECSGINQLLALTTIAIPAAYLWIGSRTGRVILCASAVVLGFASNGLRVAILGWLTSEGFRVSDPHSLIHLAPGFVSVALAYGILALLMSRLSQNGPASSSQLEGKTDRQDQAVVTDRSAARPRRLWVEAAVLALLVCAGTARMVASPLSEFSSRRMVPIPMSLSDWTLESSVEPAAARFVGFDDSLLQTYPTPSGQRRFTEVDEELLRTYRSASGGRVALYVGYYRHQEDGKELTGDVSRSLHRIASPVSVGRGDDAVVVNEVVQRRDDGERGILFWYDVNGRVVPNIYLAKLYTVWDALASRRTDGAVVMIAWEASDAADSDRARRDAVAFAEALLSLPRLVAWQVPHTGAHPVVDDGSMISSARLTFVAAQASGCRRRDRITDETVSATFQCPS